MPKHATLGEDGKVTTEQLPAGQGGAAWGEITGTLSTQTDLQGVLNAKAASEHAHTGTYEPLDAAIQSHIQSAHAPATAEQNVSADWNASSGDAQVLNKPSTLPPSSHDNAAHSTSYEAANANIQTHVTGTGSPHTAAGVGAEAAGAVTTHSGVTGPHSAATSIGGKSIPPGGIADATTLSGHTGAAAPHSGHVQVAGQIGGTAASPDVRGLRETGGPTLLTLGAVTDGQYLKRSGSTVVGDTPSGGTPPTGVLDDLQISVLQTDGTLNAASGIQTWAGTNKTAQDVFTVAANSTYRIRGQWIVNTGATTHTTAMAWALSGATVADFQYQVMLWSAAANAIATVQSTTHVSGVASKVLNATSTAVYTNIQFSGILNVTNGGTITPQINFSANPTGTNLMKRGSWTSFTRLGADTVTTTGNWG